MGKKHKKHHKKRNEEKAAKLEEPPIKLVLKVGHVEKNTEQKKRKADIQSAEIPVHKSKEHSSKKKKKRSSSKDRKKRKHDSNVESKLTSTIEVVHDRPKKKQKIDEKRDISHPEKPIIKKIHIKPIEPPRERKRIKPTVYHDAEPAPVTLCLANLHQTLQRKDVNGFFAFPVNDVIAPGYSTIITNPMDFSTMKLKIDSNSYSSLAEYRDDFNLMCNNAMIYNTPETIYFKAAKKLQQTGGKLMSVDKFRNLYRAMGLSYDDDRHHRRHDEKSSEEIIDVDTVDSNSTSSLLPPPKKKDSRPRKKNTVGQRVQAKAEEAARKAAEKLARKCPNSNIGFLRKDADGNTSLAILNPCPVDSLRSISVNLGNYTGKLSSGSVSTSVFQEDKKNKATPVNYLKYGPFSSFSPSYDSSNATITKEDSDILYQTYGDSTGTYYSQSIQAFVKDNSFAKDFVDSLLDSLTAGGHSKLMIRFKEKLLAEEEEKRKQEKIELQKKEEEERKKIAEKAAAKKTKDEKSYLKDIDFNALLSLEKEGIDMTFLKPKENQDDAKTKEIQEKLDKTASLLTKLDEVQSERLSQANDSVNGATPKTALQSSDNEQKIAEKVTQELAKLTAKVQPKEVTDVDSVRKALGVGDVSQSLRKPLDDDQDEMEVHLAAEAIETVFNETTTMEDLDKVICEAAREVEDAMGLDVLDDLTASLDDVKRLDGGM